MEFGALGHRLDGRGEEAELRLVVCGAVLVLNPVDRGLRRQRAVEKVGHDAGLDLLAGPKGDVRSIRLQRGPWLKYPGVARVKNDL